MSVWALVMVMFKKGLCCECDTDAHLSVLDTCELRRREGCIESTQRIFSRPFVTRQCEKT